MTRSVMRYVPFTIRQDPTALPGYEAECVSGEESDCGAKSGEWGTPAPVENWVMAHTRDTGHTRYRRWFVDYAEVNAPDNVPGHCAGEARQCDR